MNNGESFYIGRRKVTQHAPGNERTLWEWTVGRYWVAYEENPRPYHLEAIQRWVLLIAEPNKEDKREAEENEDRTTSAAWNTDRLRFKYEGTDLDSLKAFTLLKKFLEEQKK